MGREPAAVRARRRARAQKTKETHEDDILDEELDPDYVPTTEEQETRLAMLWVRQKEAEHFATWAIGLLSAFAAVVSVGLIVLQMHSPWVLLHFRQLKGVVTSFQLVLGVSPLAVCGALNLIIVLRPVASSLRAFSAISVVVAAAAAAGWAGAFYLAGFFTWSHLWLPVAPLLYAGVSASLMGEVYGGRSELKRLAKMIYSHETA